MAGGPRIAGSLVTGGRCLRPAKAARLRPCPPYLAGSLGLWALCSSAVGRLRLWPGAPVASALPVSNSTKLRVYFVEFAKGANFRSAEGPRKRRGLLHQQNIILLSCARAAGAPSARAATRPGCGPARRPCWSFVVARALRCAALAGGSAPLRGVAWGCSRAGGRCLRPAAARRLLRPCPPALGAGAQGGETHGKTRINASFATCFQGVSQN